MKDRVLQPELLDHLPHDDPDAVRAREEMRLVNGIMGNHRWIERMLRRHGRAGWRVAELGAGDGALSRRLVRTGLCPAEAVHGIDLAARPPLWPSGAPWTSGDVLQIRLPETEVVVANLFLHHFSHDQLRILGDRLPSVTRLVIAAEPARLWIHTCSGRLFCALARLNHVQRHDMQVSIRAGFRGQELGTALGMDGTWRVRACLHPLGGYRFVARR